MAKVVIIGAGFAGHTAAMYLGSVLGKQHEITMINQSDRFLFVPSLVWVGVGHMDVEKTRFPLKPVYDRMHVKFVLGRATEIHPDDQYVVVEMKDGTVGTKQVPYDYLVVATGPQLDFGATPGLGPEHATSYSICTSAHAVQARDQYLAAVERMRRGERQRIVIGMGHPGATCQGAAFEYVTNVHKDLVRRGVRDKADLTFLTNERALGDFGVRGVHVKQHGNVVSSEDFIRAVFKEYGINGEIQKGVVGVEPGRVHWQDFAATDGATDFDYAMLIPRFTGMPL
ncbi:MAG: FAD-dependent oxidoreductase, partial [Chloroflexi bacterium]|nr:FAD-dependent oxidoreductase [Chloroflexota bacterium]